MKITPYSKHYELADLPISIGMGNVLNVVTDRKLFEEGAFSTTTGITVADQVGISVDAQHVITKTSADGWNAGGASVETITGDGSVKWTLTNTVGENINMAVGLSTVNAASQNFTTIQYTWRTGVSSHAIYESGVIKNNYSGLVAGTVFEIRRTGSTLEYLKNGVVVRTVTGVTTSPLLVDISMYYINTKIRHLEINNSGTQRYYVADVKTFSDYYPYGMQLPYRHGEDVYRYAFNGMEKHNEIKDMEGSSYDFGARMYDPRVGRWLSIDPDEKRFPSNSSYSYASNSPILFIDFQGEHPKVAIIFGDEGAFTTHKAELEKAGYKVVIVNTGYGMLKALKDNSSPESPIEDLVLISHGSPGGLSAKAAKDMTGFYTSEEVENEAKAELSNDFTKKVAKQEGIDMSTSDGLDAEIRGDAMADKVWKEGTESHKKLKNSKIEGYKSRHSGVKTIEDLKKAVDGKRIFVKDLTIVVGGCNTSGYSDEHETQELFTTLLAKTLQCTVYGSKGFTGPTFGTTTRNSSTVQGTNDGKGTWIKTTKDGTKTDLKTSSLNLVQPQ